MHNNRLKLSATPFQVKNSYIDRISTVFLDSSIVSYLTYSLVLTIMSMHNSLLANYTGIGNMNNMSALILAYIPTHYLVSITYYFIAYRNGQSRTLANLYYKNCVVPKSFVFNTQERNFSLSNKQALRRSLANFITTTGLFLPNLIALADPYGRSFADYFSDTMTISQDEFYQLFTTKVTTHFQVFIDIENLEIQKLQTKTAIAA